MSKIENKLVHFSRFSSFEKELLAGNILDHSIVFIKDRHLVWTHGTYYSDTSDVLKITEQELTEEEKAQVRSNIGIGSEVEIGDTLPSVLPDIFIDTSRSYENAAENSVFTHKTASNGETYTINKESEGSVRYIEFSNDSDSDISFSLHESESDSITNIQIPAGKSVLYRIISGRNSLYKEKFE